MAFRIGNIAAKFLLALYTARYLGLVDLGIYGLIVWHDSDAGYSRSRHQRLGGPPDRHHVAGRRTGGDDDAACVSRRHACRRTTGVVAFESRARIAGAMAAGVGERAYPVSRAHRQRRQRYADRARARAVRKFHSVRASWPLAISGDRMGFSRSECADTVC